MESNTHTPPDSTESVCNPECSSGAANQEGAFRWICCPGFFSTKRFQAPFCKRRCMCGFLEEAAVGLTIKVGYSHLTTLLRRVS